VPPAAAPYQAATNISRHAAPSAPEGSPAGPVDAQLLDERPVISPGEEFDQPAMILAGLIPSRIAGGAYLFPTTQSSGVGSTAAPTPSLR